MQGICSVAVILMVYMERSRSADILAFYPFPGISHHRVYWPLLKELAIRGHNVTMVSPFQMADPPKNYREIKVPDYTEEVRTFEEESEYTLQISFLKKY